MAYGVIGTYDQPTYGRGLLDVAPNVQTTSPSIIDYLAQYQAANEAFRLPGGRTYERYGELPPSPPQAAPVAAGQADLPPPIIDDGGGRDYRAPRAPSTGGTANPFAGLLGGFDPSSWFGGEPSAAGATGNWDIGLPDFGGDNPFAHAQAADVAQKTLGLGGAFGASILAPFGFLAGEYGRRVANKAYSPYGEISFLEDISRPDFLYGSPEDILSNLKSGQDVVIGGGELDKDDKQGLVDYYNTKGVTTPEGEAVTVDDITDEGQIKGSEVDRMLKEQMADFGPEYEVGGLLGPTVGAAAPRQGVMDAIAQANMAAELSAMQNMGVANIMSGLGGGRTRPLGGGPAPADAQSQAQAQLAEDARRSAIAAQQAPAQQGGGDGRGSIRDRGRTGGGGSSMGTGRASRGGGGSSWF